MTGGYQPHWDHDRKYGEEGEAIVERLRGPLAGRIETKRKRYADDEFYVELEQDPGAKGVYKPSGLNVTKADYWAYVIDTSEIIVFLPVPLLRAALKAERGRRAQENDGDNPTRGRLVSLNALIVQAINEEAA